MWAADRGRMNPQVIRAKKQIFFMNNKVLTSDLLNQDHLPERNSSIAFRQNSGSSSMPMWPDWAAI